MEADQKRLVESATRGDPRALEALLERYLPALRAYVRLRVGARIRAKESCSDLVQSVCREVLGDLDEFQYRGEAAFRKWLFERALHKIVDRGRYYDAGKRDPERERPIEGVMSEDSDPGGFPPSYADLCTPSQVAIGHELQQRIEEAFDALPADYQQALLLCRVIGLSQAEAAAEMGRSERAVQSLVYRAMARLTLVLDEP